MGQDEIADLGIHAFAPAAATEDAVVARALGFQMTLLFVDDAAAQAMRGLGLARAGDVIEFSLYREERRGLDVLGAHALEFAVGGAHVPSAMHQFEVLKHGLDCFQVVVRVHVEYGVVLVVELAVGFDAGVVTTDQVLEVVIVAGGVAVGVHGHKARVLQKAGVHAATCTRKLLGHGVNNVVLEPLVTAGGRQVVHRRG